MCASRPNEHHTPRAQPPPAHWYPMPPPPQPLPPPPSDAFPSVDPRLFAALLQRLLNTERGVCAGTSPHDRATLIAALKEGAAQGLNSRQVIDRLDTVRRGSLLVLFVLDPVCACADSPPCRR